MGGAGRASRWPGCPCVVDCIEGWARHGPQREPRDVFARAPIARLAAWAHTRGWNNLELLSTAGNSYSAHYYGNTAALTPAMRAQRGYKDNENWDEPMLNVFRKDENTIRHFWGKIGRAHV